MQENDEVVIGIETVADRILLMSESQTLAHIKAQSISYLPIFIAVLSD